MGKFIGVVAAALERQGDGFVQTTDVLEFGDETWVYYCRPHVGQPRPGWMDVAAGTLRLSVKQPQFRHDQLAWQPQISRDETGASNTGLKSSVLSPATISSIWPYRRAFCLCRDHGIYLPCTVMPTAGGSSPAGVATSRSGPSFVSPRSRERISGHRQRRSAPQLRRMCDNER